MWFYSKRDTFFGNKIAKHPQFVNAICPVSIQNVLGHTDNVQQRWVSMLNSRMKVTLVKNHSSQMIQ